MKQIIPITASRVRRTNPNRSTWLDCRVRPPFHLAIGRQLQLPRQVVVPTLFHRRPVWRPVFGKIISVVPGEQECCRCPLLKIVQANNALGRLPRPTQRWQEHSRQNRDDRDYHQQLDQRKSVQNSPASGVDLLHGTRNTLSLFCNNAKKKISMRTGSASRSSRSWYKILERIAHEITQNPNPSRQKTKKAETHFGVSAFNKNWRQPTLAEPIELLPSARLCLTAEFGMGSGRTTALLPPKIVRQIVRQSAIRPNRTNQRFKEQMPEYRHSLKIAHRRNKVFYRSRVKIAFSFLMEKEKAIKPNDRLVLVR